jgi:hypothetical protein
MIIGLPEDSLRPVNSTLNVYRPDQPQAGRYGGTFISPYKMSLLQRVSATMVHPMPLKSFLQEYKTNVTLLFKASTAAALVSKRTDSEKLNMALSTWKGTSITKVAAENCKKVSLCIRNYKASAFIKEQSISLAATAILRGRTR